MRPFPFFLTAAIATLLFSCDPCKNLDCASDDYFGQFRIVSALTGKDLVFGPDKIYDKGQIKFFALQGSGTAFFEYEAVPFSGAGYDSMLHVRFYPKSDVAYMRLGNGDMDTRNIFYKTTGTRCCGTITEITNFRYNNAVDIPGGKGTQELKK